MLLVIDEWMIMCSGQTPCLPLLLTWTWITLDLLLLDDIQALPKLELDAVCLIGDGRFDSRQNPAPAMEHKQERSGSISVFAVCD